MRQAGIVAAAASVTRSRCASTGSADDHARARRLADAGWHDAGLPRIDPGQTETNSVQLDLAPLGLGRDEAIARLREAGVGLSSTIRPSVLRAVTHLDVTDDDVKQAATLVPAALGAGVARV